jgi:hypothetical protein
MIKFKLLCGLESMLQEAFKTNLKYYVNLIRWWRMKSWPNLRWYVDRNRWLSMLSWPNIYNYLYWKVYDRKLSRPTWSIMLVRTEDTGWCVDLIWSALWIGTDVNKCFHPVILIDMWIGKDVTWSFHDQFVVLCGLDQMIEDDAMN